MLNCATPKAGRGCLKINRVLRPGCHATLRAALRRQQGVTDKKGDFPTDVCEDLAVLCGGTAWAVGSGAAGGGGEASHWIASHPRFGERPLDWSPRL
ncbi:hypothetical protein NDU88_005442 [Pleurodeles waltl]|uniref:Uncharacterized protein n=1 Tax=Pleurodeles waltl TaxID=8319 RepID=A0AAV7L4V7_PLEWA|nr:hypothetical protein NDU88_005442 [Pleurodeles waltl]